MHPATVAGARAPAAPVLDPPLGTLWVAAVNNITLVLIHGSGGGNWKQLLHDHDSVRFLGRRT